MARLIASKNIDNAFDFFLMYLEFLLIFIQWFNRCVIIIDYCVNGFLENNEDMSYQKRLHLFLA